MRLWLTCAHISPRKMAADIWSKGHLSELVELVLKFKLKKRKKESICRFKRETKKKKKTFTWSADKISKQYNSTVKIKQSRTSCEWLKMKRHTHKEFWVFSCAWCENRVAEMSKIYITGRKNLMLIYVTYRLVSGTAIYREWQFVVIDNTRANYK